ncbi:MAG: hypothetical protein HQL59_04760 [Magnetococcales bacterium]|nr:hypothetical protein [Magnetococcales bacterium]
MLPTASWADPAMDPSQRPLPFFPLGSAAAEAPAVAAPPSFQIISGTGVPVTEAHETPDHLAAPPASGTAANPAPASPGLTTAAPGVPVIPPVSIAPDISTEAGSTLTAAPAPPPGPEAAGLAAGREERIARMASRVDRLDARIKAMRELVTQTRALGKAKRMVRQIRQLSSNLEAMRALLARAEQASGAEREELLSQHHGGLREILRGLREMALEEMDRGSVGETTASHPESDRSTAVGLEMGESCHGQRHGASCTCKGKGPEQSGMTPDQGGAMAEQAGGMAAHAGMMGGKKCGMMGAATPDQAGTMAGHGEMTTAQGNAGAGITPGGASGCSKDGQMVCRHCAEKGCRHCGMMADKRDRHGDHDLAARSRHGIRGGHLHLQGHPSPIQSRRAKVFQAIRDQQKLLSLDLMEQMLEHLRVAAPSRS